MYKIFEVTYNDGGWHTGGLPNFFYIAKCKEDLIAHSKKYQMFLEWQELGNGDIWIHEVSGLVNEFCFENLAEFDITVSVKKKD